MARRYFACRRRRRRDPAPEWVQALFPAVGDFRQYIADRGWFQYARVEASRIFDPDFADQIAATVRGSWDSTSKIDCPLCGCWLYGRDGLEAADTFARHLDRDH